MRKFQKILLFGLYTIVPCVFNPSGGWIFELPKSRLLYLLICLIILSLIWTSRKFPFSKLSWAVLIYILGLLVLGVFNALNPKLAFLGSYERQLGFLGYFHLLLVPLFFPEIIKTISKEKIYVFIAWGSLAASFLTLLQLTPFSPFGSVLSFGFRLYGPLGEPNLLGYFLVLTLFPIWTTLLKQKKLIKRCFYFLILCLNIFVTLKSGSRGALLALGLFFLILGLWYGKYSWQHYRKTLMLSSLTLLIVLSFLSYQQIQDRHSYLNLRILNNVTIQIRLKIWEQTWQKATDRWLTGHGLEALAPAFQERSPSLSKLLYDPQEIIDRAHNDFLDHFYMGGIAGIALYIFFFGTSLYYAFKHCRRKRDFLPLGIISQFLLLSSVGPVNSLAILFLVTALALINIELKGTQVTISLPSKLLFSLLLLFCLTFNLVLPVIDTIKPTVLRENLATSTLFPINPNVL